MDQETFDHNTKDKQTEILLENIIDHSGSKYSSCESGSSIDSERQLNFINKGESGKNNYSNTHINCTNSISSSATRSSSSSSSSKSTLNDFLIREEEFKYISYDESTLASNLGNYYDSNGKTSDKSKVDNNLSISTTYKVYNLDHNQKNMLPTISPSTQVMDRSERYDAFRAPSSIFETNTNPSEWREKRNDSIKMGIPQKQSSRQTFELTRASRDVPMLPLCDTEGSLSVASATSASRQQTPASYDSTLHRIWPVFNNDGVQLMRAAHG
ncbi:hypothetical protein Fmac_003154 [Flemingia macrophylla]|uniref:Uncharacterized protein n=1 Tax=Flemingia macrophylla TaxID=520843 RepID=A0ABD1NLY8_9FABA